MNVAEDFAEGCSYDTNEQYSSIGSDSGLTSTTQQAIISTNDG